MKTCGIFLINDEDLLSVHPTNASWKNWSIPKGELELNEFELDRAILEMKEETNVDLEQFRNHIHLIDSIKYKNRDKTLVAYVLYLPNVWRESFEDLKCTSTFYNEKLKIHQPENDKVEWIKIENILKYNMLHETQIQILKQLKLRSHV